MKEIWNLLTCNTNYISTNPVVQGRHEEQVGGLWNEFIGSGTR
jgi:hypothetical protein